MEYCIRYISLPYRIKGITVLDEMGFYNIYINSNLSYDQQKKALLHELQHIARKDFDRTDSSIFEIENIQ